MRGSLVIGLTALVAACGGPAASPSPSFSPSQHSSQSPSVSPNQTLRARLAPASSTTTSDGVRLTFQASRASYREGETIEAKATLTYLGPAPTLEVAGSGVGLVAFGVHQLDGGLDAGAGMTADCRPYTLARGEARVLPFSRSGGYSEDSRSPNDEFAKRYLASPTFTLPAGRWEVFAFLMYAPPGCSGPETQAAASVVVEVAAA